MLSVERRIYLAAVLAPFDSRSVTPTLAMPAVPDRPVSFNDAEERKNRAVVLGAVCLHLVTAGAN